MSIPSHQMFQVARITTSAAVKASAGRVVAVNLFGGSAATSLKLTNDADGLGTPLLDVNTVIADTRFVDLSEMGGIVFGTAIYATIAGAGGIAEVFYE